MSIKINNDVKKYIYTYKTKSGTKWRVCIPDGKSGQKRARGFRDQTSALAYAKETYKEILFSHEKSSILLNPKLTFGEYSKIWIDLKKRNGCVEATIRRYQDQLNQFLIPYFSSFKLCELNKNHLRNFIIENQDSNVSTYNVRSTVIIFKMIIKQAAEDDFMQLSNIALVRTPKHKARDPRFWDQNEMIFFLNATKERKCHDLWKFVLYSGLRASEVGALMWDCVHFSMKSGNHTGYIEVKRSCAQKTRKISERTKNGDRRMVPIFPQVFNLLLEKKARATGEFVFGNESPLDTSHFNRLLQRDLASIPELKKINFHGLRHTFCSFVDSTGMNRRVVSEIMGHRDLSTTDRYSHVSNQTLGFEVTKWYNGQSKQQISNVSLTAL